jgi:hypothetical protein
VKLKRNTEQQLELCQQIINVTGGKGRVEKVVVVVMVMFAVVEAVVVLLLLMLNQYLNYIHAELNSYKPITELA